MLNIQIKYFTDKIDEIHPIGNCSDWIDLRVAEDVEMKAGDWRLIPLGVAMKLPEGYAFEVAIAVGHKAVEKEPHTYSMEKNVTSL